MATLAISNLFDLIPGEEKNCLKLKPEILAHMDYLFVC